MGKVAEEENALVRAEESGSVMVAGQRGPPLQVQGDVVGWEMEGVRVEDVSETSPTAKPDREG